jgi:predicted MFS family arabinose efflux permease
LSAPVQPDPATNLHDETFSVRRLMVIGLATRLLLDTGIQIFFPFLPVIAAGLGSNTIALGRLVSLRSATGLVAPLFGALADRRGYRTVMRLGLLLAALGYLVVAMSPNLWLAAIGMILAGLGTFAFVPAIQAYLSARLPYARRARGLGILEYAWALAGIVGLFLVGMLIDAAGWRAPLFILSAGLFVAWLFYQTLPPARPAAAGSPVMAGAASPARLARLSTFFSLGANRRSAWSTIAAGGLIMFAAMHLFISFGAWLVTEYGLSAAELGRVALVLGIADLCGSGLVSLISDRAGKRRSVILGAALACVGFLCLPLFNKGIVAAVTGLIWVRFAFEFTLVSNMTLLSEQVPLQRGKVLTLGAAATLLGSTVAGFTGPLAYARFGVLGLGVVPAVAFFMTVILTHSLIREQ